MLSYRFILKMNGFYYFLLRQMKYIAVFKCGRVCYGKVQIFGKMSASTIAFFFSPNDNFHTKAADFLSNKSNLGFYLHLHFMKQNQNMYYLLLS